MRPDGSPVSPALPSVLRLILTIPNFVCNQTTSAGVLVRLQPYPTPGSWRMPSHPGATGTLT